MQRKKFHIHWEYSTETQRKQHGKINILNTKIYGLKQQYVVRDEREGKR
jgi:hypothetical protein